MDTPRPDLQAIIDKLGWYSFAWEDGQSTIQRRSLTYGEGTGLRFSDLPPFDEVLEALEWKHFVG